MAECGSSVVSNDISTNKQINSVENSAANKENKTDNAMEPIFVDDFQNEELPKSIQYLLKFLEESEASPSRNDILVGLIYILTLETEFVPSHYDELTTRGFDLSKLLEYTTKLPSNWKQNSSYQFTFYVPGFKQHQCKIVCCPSIDDLVVNCYVQDIEYAKYTIYLDTLTYFSSSSVTIHNLRLQNLRGLSYKVKEAICYQAKQAILRQYSQLEKNLEALPEEIIILIVNKLPTKNFVRFGMTCKKFNRIMKTPILWYKRIEKDLNLYPNRDLVIGWSEIAEMYRRKRHIPQKLIFSTVYLGRPVML